MTTDTPRHTTAQGSNETFAARRAAVPFVCLVLLLAAVLAVLYWKAGEALYINWTLVDSYYSHGFLVPAVSAFFVWRNRRMLLAQPLDPSRAGFVWIAVAAALLLLGDFLGFTIFGNLSILPMLAGVCIVLMGKARTRAVWFPIAFLFFMVPIPPSLTQSISLKLKLVAASSAVKLANLVTLPMVQEGSYIHFNDDFLLVGEVCGGLRSLIALLALGAIVAYMSNVKSWAKVVLLLMSGPIAVAANIVRIFFLCVVGYFYGSEIAAGKVHDYSGVLIFAVAIMLFVMIETPLRKIAPEPDPPQPDAAGVAPEAERRRVRYLFITVGVLLAVTVVHLLIVTSQASAGTQSPAASALNVPDQIVDYKRLGADLGVDEHTIDILETSSILIRNYVSPRGRPVQLTVVHAGATRRSLHFPEVCLVGEGWEIREQEVVPVGLSFSARRLVLVKGESKEAVLYWFKTGDVMTGNFFINAMYWAKNQLMFGSPTSSMIKLTTVVGTDGEAGAFAALDDFAAKVTPVIRTAIP